jgi:iron only hydrogenase large subunit-like protein/uncharacterized Fe-S cluster-containing protein
VERQQEPNQIVFTNKARCRDCYRCVRVCPVKAIRMAHGQAYVEGDRCISCGTCIRECPQGAKQWRNDVTQAREIVKSADLVAASVAPSFAAVFSEWERRRLPSALRKLGFSYVGETAIGAYHTAARTAEVVREQPEHTHIGTACPAAVSYIEGYRPDLVGLLTPVCSPMIAHARHIKSKLGDRARVIFIGPCVAKKAEAERPQNAGAVDCALTFTELMQWLEAEGISLDRCEESDFDEQPQGQARFFPLEGGSLRTADLSADLLAMDNLSVSGYENVREAFDEAADGQSPALIEPLFCPHGCVGGPGISLERNLYERRGEVLTYATRHAGAPAGSKAPGVDLSAEFGAQPVESEHPVLEEEIRRVLAQTGKATPEDELNCGACGYPTCRDKAVAVLRGMAEVEMCLPFMRRVAEQRTDKIIETSPNGIVILDERLNVISMNPAFRRMFMCTEAVLGKPISYLMDPDPFERVASGAEQVVEATKRHERYGIVCHQLTYGLPEDNQYVGIFVNITKSQADQEKLDRLRAQTVAQAQELLQHQVTMAQQISRFLGESAAQGERLVENLLSMASEGTREAQAEDDWRSSTYTSK